MLYKGHYPLFKILLNNKLWVLLALLRLHYILDR